MNSNEHLLDAPGLSQRIGPKQRELDDRFLAIFEQAAVGVARLSPEGYWLDVNQRLCAIVGYSRDELVTKTLQDITHPEDLEKDLNYVRQLLAGEIQTYTIEKRYRRRDGDLVWVNLTVSLVREQTGSPLYFISVVEDITPRKRAEKALKESEERFRAIVEQAPLGIAEGEIDGARFVSVNQRYADILGYSIAELQNLTFKDFTHPDDLSMDLAEMKKLAAGEIQSFTIEKRYVRKNGATVWVNLNVAGLGPAGTKPLNCMAIVEDITMRKETELALRESEARYKAIVEAEPECVKVVDANGKLLEMNPAGLVMLEANSIEEAQSRGLIEFILPQYRMGFETLHQDAIRGSVGLLEFELTGLRGKRRWLETHAAPLPDADGRITKMLGITRDITQRKQSESSVRRLNAELEERVFDRTAQLEMANKELESFSYSVSHDLRAPLRGVDGYLRILLEDYGAQLDTEGNRLIGVARSEAKRMGRLIDDLLTFSRMSRQHLENMPINMTDLARAAFESVTSSITGTLPSFEIGPLPSAMGDPQMLRQVFVNLIDNAVKFCRNSKEPIIEVGFTRDTEGTTYFVRDNGAGFDEKYSQKLFGVFQRLHSVEEYEGTGIGLALVQRIVQRHGGCVHAKGKLNAGATFGFTLPSVKKSRQ